MTPWCPASRQALLALQFLLLGAAGYSLDVNGLEGGEIALTPVYSGTAHGYVWKQGNNKIVEIDFPEQPLYYRPPDKYVFNSSTGVLTIMDLRLNDEAKYVAEVLINNVYSPTTFDLSVFPSLNKPTVNCTNQDKNVTIQCRLALISSRAVSYRWDIRSKEQTQPEYRLSNDNKTLTLKDVNRNSLDSLDCVVKNPVTENRTSVALTCFPEENKHRFRNGVIVCVVLFCIAVMVAVVYGYCIKRAKEGVKVNSHVNREECDLMLNSSQNRSNTELPEGASQGEETHLPTEHVGECDLMLNSSQNRSNTELPEGASQGEETHLPTEHVGDQSISETRAPGKEPSEDRAQTPKDPSGSAAHEGSQEKLNNTSKESEDRPPNGFVSHSESEESGNSNKWNKTSLRPEDDTKGQDSPEDQSTTQHKGTGEEPAGDRAQTATDLRGSYSQEKLEE